MLVHRVREAFFHESAGTLGEALDDGVERAHVGELGRVDSRAKRGNDGWNLGGAAGEVHAV